MIRLSCVVILISIASSAGAAVAKVEIVNNQAFPIRFPWKLQDGKRIIVDVAGSGRQTIDATVVRGTSAVLAEAVEDGIRLKNLQRDLGTLQWDVLVEELKKKPTDKEAAGTTRDFDTAFEPMAMKFDRSTGEALFHRWSAAGEKAGLKLHVNLDVYHAGFVEVQTTVTNVSAPQANVYAAVLTRWLQPAGSTNKCGYDNRVIDLSAGGATPFRAGEGRHHFIQRGADWFNTTLPGDGRSIAWLNDFAPSWTLHHEAGKKTPAHWSGANTAQLAQEAIVTRAGDKLYSITEIARPNLKMYASRVTGNVLPDKDQPLSFSSLLIFNEKKVEDSRVDELFVAYSSYNEETKTGDTTRVTFGVPHVKFGTAYFPYSTLGENFEKWHMPGMSKETYWPLAVDIVINYKLFADDIRRDLRIAKAMGFESIRLHHLELIDMLDPRHHTVRDEFLDFFFGELKHLGLTALLDVKLPPARVAELVKRYRPQVDGVEIDNEVLIFGINDQDVPVWKETYKAVKAVAPDLPVWLTGHTNTGAFERLRKLGVPFDKVGAHAYMDSLDAIPSGRNYALAISDYASEIGKPPAITEWNWRFLTRMTPEARAKVYPPIFENVLATRCMPLMYQFQFQESLAMTSKSLRGIRHYELLNLSRRPKPEAFEFMKLIKKYGNPASPQAVLKTEDQQIDLPPHSPGYATTAIPIAVTVRNNSNSRRRVTATAEGTPYCSITGVRRLRLNPNESATVHLRFSKPSEPGFYHTFVRFEDDQGTISYAWVEARNPGPLKIDKGESKFHPQVTYMDGALDYDFNRDIAIVYPHNRDNASRWDVESAWLIYQTLEAATGRPVKIFQINDLPADWKKNGNLIFVDIPAWDFSKPPQTDSSGNAIAGEKTAQPSEEPRSWVKRIAANDEHGDWLIVGGDDEASLNRAAIDLVLRYWKFAKDSGMRRIPLTDKPISKGGDPTLLP